jgi:CelD/BcsL family acetyltransferase involved in cellulose biosynthesis
MIDFYPVRLNRLDRDAWDNLIDKRGNVFQLSKWLELWEKSFPFQAFVYLAVDGDKIVGGIPFCQRMKFRFKEAYSMPRGCYGGAVVEDNGDIELRQKLESEFTYWCMREKFTRVNMVQFSPELNTNLNAYDVNPKYTHVLNLKYSSEEQLARLRRSHKRNIPDEDSHSFEFSDVSSLDDVEDYFDLIQATATRQSRKPHYRIEFFRALFDIFYGSPKLFWPKVTYHGRTISSGIFFVHRKSTFCWYAVSNQTAFEQNANFFLFWETIKIMKQKGIETLNFGSGPQNKKGLNRFKTGWGTDRVNYFEYNYQRPLSRLAGKVRRMF